MKPCIDVRWLRLSFWHPSNHRRTLSSFSTDRQQTEHSVCSEWSIYGGIRSTATKSIAIGICHVPNIMGNLSFGLFAPFVLQKAQKVQNPYSEKSELSAFSVQSGFDNVNNVNSSRFQNRRRDDACRWWRSFRGLKNIVTTVTHRQGEYSVLSKLYCSNILLWD